MSIESDLDPRPWAVEYFTAWCSFEEFRGEIKEGNEFIDGAEERTIERLTAAGFLTSDGRYTQLAESFAVLARL